MKDKEIQPKDILIVDDEVSNLKLLTQLLSQQGYQVRPAERPQMAIDSALAHPPILILLDVKMPGMDGFEVCKFLKKDERTRDIPIIFISALQDVQDRVQGFEAGGVDFISKPFQEEEVLARVGTHLNLRILQLNLEQIIDERTAQTIESETRFRATFEQAAVGVAHVSTEGKFLRVNRKFCQIVGYSEEEMFGLSFQEITHADDLTDDLVFVGELLNGERESYAMDKRYYRKDGAIVWINLTVSLLFDRKGKAKYFVSVIKDISDRKQAEEALHQSYYFQRHLFKTVPDAIFSVGMPERIIEWANDSFGVLGYESNELIGKTGEKIYSSTEDYEATGALLQDTINAGQKTLRTESLLRRENGEIFPAEINSSIFRIKGEAVSVTSLVRDISERKQAEESLRTNRDFLKHLISAVPDAIFSVKMPERIINWANDSFDVMGYEDEEFIGRSTKDFFANPEEYDMVGDLHRDAIRNGENMIRSEVMVHHKDGSVFPVELTASFFKENKKVSHVTAFVRDITDRKQAENEAKQSIEEIKKLQKQLQAESTFLQEEIKLEHNFENIIGQSESLKYVLHRIEMVAPQHATVLILGETGTGKELIARAVHQLSSRSKRPLVKVNCAALPRELIESELFGRTKGAFTGATTTQAGRFEMANGSTLFLDEIGELPFELQAKLLRVLESGEFERLGSSHTLHSDVRIIAATNRNLEEEIEKNRFREDLWYRLKVFPITLPPLRERTEDIPMLTNSFVQLLARKMGKNADTIQISKRIMQELKSYPWPGNVRELKHIVEGALITMNGNKLHFDLPKNAKTIGTSNFKSLEEMEREYILEILQAKNWKIEGKDSAASILGLNPSTLRSRLKKLDLKKP